MTTQTLVPSRNARDILPSLAILVIGATGNTGSSTVKHVCQFIYSTPISKQTRKIIVFTRDVNSATSKELAQIPHVEIKDKDWTTRDVAWLAEAKVCRVYLAPHNFPN